VAAGLPVAAESGTLRASFTETPVAGRLLGKTGTLNNPPFDQDPPAVTALVVNRTLTTALAPNCWACANIRCVASRRDSVSSCV
jgi:D-alanyl-D-alanine carboxypeptidase